MKSDNTCSKENFSKKIKKIIRPTNYLTVICIEWFKIKLKFPYEKLDVSTNCRTKNKNNNNNSLTDSQFRIVNLTAIPVK